LAKLEYVKKTKRIHQNTNIDNLTAQSAAGDDLHFTRNRRCKSGAMLNTTTGKQKRAISSTCKKFDENILLVKYVIR